MAAFRQLEDRGFIQPRQRGSFQWKQRHATSWLLTEYDDDMTGHKATKDFMKWRPEDAAKNKSRMSERQQPVAGPATNEPRVIQSVAGATTDSPGSRDGSVAGANTQRSHMLPGGDPGRKPPASHERQLRHRAAMFRAR
jgi:hypothetical protein